MKNCSSRKTFPKAKLEFMRADGDGNRIKYYEVELSDVLIGSMDQVAYFGHKSHRKGLEVDCRPVRKDGRHVPVTYDSPDYDLAATTKLIGLFRACAAAPLVIFFNDVRIPGTRWLKKHDDHFHVQF